MSFVSSLMLLLFFCILLVSYIVWAVRCQKKMEETPNYYIDESINDHKTAAYDLFEELVAKHRRVLLTKAHQNVGQDEYGYLEVDGWLEEFANFLEKVYLRECEERGINIIGVDFNELLKKADHILLTDELDPYSELGSYIDDCDSTGDITPLEFEHLCKDMLIASGWIARVTKASGDQGVDIIAEKESIKMVVQCKYYKNPVGNKAVQEIFSAKQHELADYAVVVTNSKYTKSAQELSQTCDVLLLHYSQLAEIDSLVENFE